MRVGGSRIVCEPSYVPVENLVFGRLAYKGMNAEIESMMAAASAASEDNKEEADVSQEEMASRLAQNMAKKFGSKRDSAGKPNINKNLATTDQLLLAQTSSFLSAARAEADTAKKTKTTKTGFLKPKDDD